MTTSMTQLIHIPRSALFGGLIVLSGLISLTIQTPTHALSLDLGKTVTTVVNSVPIVNTLTPLLMTPTVTTPVVTTPTVAVPTTPTVAPTQTTTPGVTSTPTATSTTATTAAPAATASNVTATPSSQALSTAASTQARSAITPVGLSVATKQNEIAAAAAHPASPAVTYTSRALDPKVAGTIFYLGIAGIFIGGCIMFAVRPRMAVA